MAITPPEDRLRRIETKLDSVHEQLADFRVLVEARITSLEVKSGLWGIAGGFLAALLALFLRKI